MLINIIEHFVHASGLMVILTYVIKNHWLFIFILGSSVKFNHPVYSVKEDDALVQPELVLSNPTSSEFTLQVEDNTITATGKLIEIKLNNILW